MIFYSLTVRHAMSHHLTLIGGTPCSCWWQHCGNLPPLHTHRCIYPLLTMFIPPINILEDTAKKIVWEAKKNGNLRYLMPILYAKLDVVLRLHPLTTPYIFAANLPRGLYGRRWRRSLRWKKELLTRRIVKRLSKLRRNMLWCVDVIKCLDYP